MADTVPTAVDYLKSIDKKLEALLALAQKAPSAAPAAAAGAAPGVRLATDYEMSGEYGDPVVKMKDPKSWTGPTMAGRKFSECPPEYLDMVADRLEYFAAKAEETNELASNGKPKAEYNRLDARRARGWATRLRAGWEPPAGVAPASAPATDDIPW